MSNPEIDNQAIHPVILSGGSGMRLWPLSRAHYPKQFLPLQSPLSMLQEAAGRVSGDAFAPSTVICNEEHRFIVAEQFRAIDQTPAAIVLEPVGRNTAPAVAVAAQIISAQNANAMLLVLPSDHVVTDLDAFAQAVKTASRAAADGALVTFGIPPTKAETGYGYVRHGAPWEGADGCFRVSRFVEKPNQATAEEFVASEEYLWNSGMFLFRAEDFLNELHRLQPAMADACHRAVDGSVRDLDFIRLDPAAFAEAPSLSIDYAVMEQTAAAAVVPVDMGWSDVGSWGAMWEIGERDGDGNAVSGDVLAEDVHDSLIRADGLLVVALGVRDLVIVATDDAVLVTARERAQDVKIAVDLLKQRARNEYATHSIVYRPWGHYQGVDAGEGFQVKHIMVKPGAKLSLQRHKKRAEHWIVVAGTAKVTRGEETLLIEENQSTYIPVGMKHRLENSGKTPLRVIEVQSGDYLGEDDIERFDDAYGRD